MDSMKRQAIEHGRALRKRDRLDYFTTQALVGLLANPAHVGMSHEDVVGQAISIGALAMHRIDDTLDPRRTYPTRPTHGRRT
jgi:hypothetical protein